MERAATRCRPQKGDGRRRLVVSRGAGEQRNEDGVTRVPSSLPTKSQLRRPRTGASG